MVRPSAYNQKPFAFQPVDDSDSMDDNPGKRRMGSLRDPRPQEPADVTQRPGHVRTRTSASPADSAPQTSPTRPRI